MNTSRQIVLKLCFTHSVKTGNSAGIVYGFHLFIRYQGLFRKGKVVGVLADHPPLSSAKVKNGRALPPLLHMP
jgi:hypothetical protein